MGCIPYTTVLLMCCTIACVASVEQRSMYEPIARVADSSKTVVVQEVSRQRNISGGQAVIANNPTWGNIRIRYFADDMNDQSKYCPSASGTRSDLRGGSLPCSENNMLTPERKSRILNLVIPRAIQLHADRLLVEIAVKVLITPFTGICGNFGIPPNHHVVGVDAADTVLYVAAAPALATSLVWTETCASLENGRPTVGVMNISPEITLNMQSVRLVARAITHILGFNVDMFRKYANVTEISHVRGKQYVTLFSSRKIKEKTRAHFNCPTAEGMELEDEGGQGSAFLHWKRRNAKDELMSSIMGVGSYTALTMAAMEDLGFYKALWGMEEPMKWGKGAGCRLLTEKCVEDGVSQDSNMFCTDTTGPLRCTSDRRALGRCNLKTFNSELPTFFQYFSDPKLGGPSESYMDYCPSTEAAPNTACMNGYGKEMHASRVGLQSRCVKGVGLIKDGVDVGDVCVEVSCIGLEIVIRHVGSGIWYDCPEGRIITPTAPFTGGQILCPTREEVCVGMGDEIEGYGPVTTTMKPQNSSPSISVLLPTVFLAVIFSVIAVCS